VKGAFPGCLPLSYGVYIEVDYTSGGSQVKTKLTLRVKKSVVEKAKKYSSERGESVSGMVEKIFEVLTEDGRTEDLTPVVKKLKGILKGSGVSEEDYKRYLEEKYL